VEQILRSSDWRDRDFSGIPADFFDFDFILIPVPVPKSDIYKQGTDFPAFAGFFPESVAV
jgi:hypothetical protein